MLDADEVFDADLAAFVVQICRRARRIANVAFAFARIGDFLGRWLPGQDRAKHTRLYNRTHCMDIARLKCTRAIDA